jgi:iron complex transport system ATP-binding protein
MSALLQAKSLCVVRGKSVLLRDVSLCVNAGEVLVLLGANGAGKSTLLAALAGEEAAQEGKVELDGAPLAQWSLSALSERRALNIVEPPLAFSLAVFDVVALGRPFARRHEAQVRLALDECHAAHWAARDASTLSSGEMLRVQLARSLYQLGDRARCVWLLDEPMAHLDLAQRQFALKLLRDVAARHQWAVVVSSHEPRDAKLIADRVLLLREGEVLAYGAPHEVLTIENLSECYDVGSQWVSGEFN